MSVENTSEIRLNNTGSRSLARANMSVENTTEIRHDNTGSRSLARTNMSVENTSEIRHNDTRSRSLARANMSVENTSEIRHNDTGSRIVARTVQSEIHAANIRAADANLHVNDRLLNSEELRNRYNDFWGDIHKVNQRTVEPKCVEDYINFEHHTGSSKFLSHESLGVVQLQENSTFLENESTFIRRLTHMENIKV